MQAFPTDEYQAYLTQYNTLLGQLLQAHTDMFAALTGNELEQVRHNMNLAQAASMRMEQLETGREELQAEFGYAGLGIRQTVEQLPDEVDTQPLLALVEQIEHNAQEIRFWSEKSSSLVQCTLADLDPDFFDTTATPKPEEGTKKENPYEKFRDTGKGRLGLEIKT